MRPSNLNVQPVPILMKETLVKYIVQTIAWFRRQFPNHPDFVDLDPNDAQDGPDWWRQGMMEKVGKDIEAFQKRLDSDFTFGSTPTRPLYYRNSLNVLERGEGGPVDANGILQNELAVARSPESQRKRRAEEDAKGSGQHKRAANAKGRPVAVGAAVASVAPTRTTQTMMEKLIQLTSADGQAAHYKLIGMDHWSLRLWRHATMESVRLP